MQECLIRIAKAKFPEEKVLSDALLKLFTQFILKTSFRNRAAITERNAKHFLKLVGDYHQEKWEEELRRKPLSKDTTELSNNDVLKKILNTYVDVPVDLVIVWVSMQQILQFN